MKLSMKHYCLFLFSFFTLLLSAQTQQGYVKTLGRPNQKGVALSGVSVRVKGGHNAVLSNTQGFFSMSMIGKKSGDPYALQQVQKQGFELKEKGVIGRQYAFSEKTPLTIVMVSSKQLQADKQRIENNAYKVAEKNYKSKLEQLEKQKASNAITIEQYRQQLQDLQNKFDKYQSLIDDLADHYAHVDYDDLDEKEQEINSCIEQGDLERADSLLQQMGIQQRAEDIARHLAVGQQLMDEAQQDQAAVLKQQEKDAEYLYQLYTISLGRFDNEKARFYIETRAELDTTNVEWQTQAFDFLCENIADYNKALAYAQRAFYIEKKNHGEYSLNVAAILNLIGTIFYYKGQIDEALTYHEKALKLQEELSTNPIKDIVGSHICIGNIYSQKSINCRNNHEFQQSEHYRLLMDDNYGKALLICLKLDNPNHDLVAECCYCNGFAWMVYSQFENGKKSKEKIEEYRTKALYFFNEAIKEWEESLNYGNIGTCYMTMSGIYRDRNDYETTLEYVTKALNILLKVYGNYHHHVATCLHALGAYYCDLGKRDLALDYYTRAYEIRKVLFGDLHQETQITYEAMIKNEDIIKAKIPNSLIPEAILVNYYNKNFDYDNAIDSLFAVKKILDTSKENHFQINAELHYCFGLIYYREHNYEKAIESYKQSLFFYQKANSILSIKKANINYEIGSIYEKKIHDFHKALQYLVDSYNIRKEIEKVPTIGTAEICSRIGSIYNELEDYIVAIEFYEKSLDIYENIYGKDHYEVRITRRKIKNIQSQIKQEDGTE